jgi:hypothetical protein
MREGFTEVDEATFKAFMAAYPRKLEHNCVGFCDPPPHNYHDWALAKSSIGTAEAASESIVCYCVDDWLAGKWLHYVRSDLRTDQVRCTGESEQGT